MDGNATPPTPPPAKNVRPMLVKILISMLIKWLLETGANWETILRAVEGLRTDVTIRHNNLAKLHESGVMAETGLMHFCEELYITVRSHASTQGKLAITSPKFTKEQGERLNEILDRRTYGKNENPRKYKDI